MLCECIVLDLQCFVVFTMWMACFCCVLVGRRKVMNLNFPIYLKKRLQKKSRLLRTSKKLSRKLKSWNRRSGKFRTCLRGFNEVNIRFCVDFCADFCW